NAPTSTRMQAATAPSDETRHQSVLSQMEHGCLTVTRRHLLRPCSFVKLSIATLREVRCERGRRPWRGWRPFPFLSALASDRLASGVATPVPGRSGHEL